MTDAIRLTVSPALYTVTYKIMMRRSGRLMPRSYLMEELPRIVKMAGELAKNAGEVGGVGGRGSYKKTHVVSVGWGHEITHPKPREGGALGQAI